VSERRRRRRTSDSDAQRVQCSNRVEGERAAHTAALALLPIRLRHKRRTFCACPREPFLSIAVPAYSRGGAAIPGPTTGLARQTADGSDACRFLKREVGILAVLLHQKVSPQAAVAAHALPHHHHPTTPQPWVSRRRRASLRR
jgi:hypothetical protein